MMPENECGRLEASSIVLLNFVPEIKFSKECNWSFMKHCAFSHALIIWSNNDGWPSLPVFYICTHISLSNNNQQVYYLTNFVISQCKQYASYC